MSLKRYNIEVVSPILNDECFIVKESRAYVNDICNFLYYILYTITDRRYSLHRYSLAAMIEELSSEASIMLENM